MIDLISKQAAIDALGDEPEVWTGKDEYAQGLNNQWHYDRNAIKALPQAQTERKKGKWIGGELGYCSACGHKGCASDIWDDGEMNFCPHCGAKMEVENE